MSRKVAFNKRLSFFSLCLLVACLMGILTVTYAAPPKIIKVGAIYPLSGPMAVTGNAQLKAGAQLAVDIINEKYDMDFLMAKTEGIPSLGGAKIQLVVADSLGDPKTGMAEAERLITSEKVVALVGCYQSSVTKTASQVAEKYGIPFVNGDSSSPLLTERGFKWFFRTDPHDGIYGRQVFEFMKTIEKEKGVKFSRIAVVHENTEVGVQGTKALEELAKEFGYNIVARVPFTTGATSLTSEVTRLMAAKPDVVFTNAYISDTILFVKTFKNMRFAPTMWVHYGAPGEPDYLKTLGADGNFVFLRQGFVDDLALKKPIINEVKALFKKKYGTDMLADAVRAFHAPLALADAINRAGSTEPEAIRKALLETNIPGKYTLSPWEGIKFDPETHQNIYGKYVVAQIQNQDYYTVFPREFASKDYIFPYPKWENR